MRPQLDVRFLRHSDLPGFEVAVVTRSTHAFPNHAHDHYTVGLMESGGSYCLGPAREWSLVGPGQLALINPGQVHSGIPPQGVRPSYRMFYVDPVWLRRADADLAGQDRGFPEFDRLILTAPEATRAFWALSRLLEGGAERLALQSAMVMAFSTLLEAATESGRPARPKHPPRPEHQAIRRVRDYLAAHLADKVSLDDLAETANLSRYHLLRVFKRATGVSPHSYHLQLRVAAARRLLRQGQAIAEVAQDTGFTDQSHFTNTFRQMLGATPGQYAAR